MMEWLNEGVGLIVLLTSAVIILLVAIVLGVLLVLRNKISVQRLNFLGRYSTDVNTRERFAECTIGNRSLNEVALTEIGIRNGKVSYDLTDLYKKKMRLGKDARIVIEQRSSLRFSLTEDELMAILIDGKKGKELKTLRIYAIDLTGTLYSGKIRSVRKLLAERIAGHVAPPVHAAPLPPEESPALPPAPEPEPAPAPEPAPEEIPAPLPPVTEQRPERVYPPVTEQKPAPEGEPVTTPLEDRSAEE